MSKLFETHERPEKCLHVGLRGSKYLDIYFLDMREERRIRLLTVFEAVAGQREGHLFQSLSLSTA